MSENKEQKEQSNLQIIVNLLIKSLPIQIAFSIGLAFILTAFSVKIYTSDTFDFLGVKYGTCPDVPKEVKEGKDTKQPKIDVKAIEEKILNNLMEGDPDDVWEDEDEDMEFGN
jgi:hypothetical protein